MQFNSQKKPSTMSRTLSCSVAFLLLVGLGIAQSAGPEGRGAFDRTLSTSLAWDADGLQRIQLRARPGGGGPKEIELSIARVSPSGDRSRRALWKGTVLAPAWRDSLSLARSGRGTNVIAGTMVGGASRMVAIWSTGSPGGGSEASFDSIRELRCLGGPIGVGEPASVTDLFAPNLLGWRGDLCIVASGRCTIGQGPLRSFAWASVLPEDRMEAQEGLWRNGIDGYFVAEGVDPRVVVMGREAIVTVRGKPEEPAEATVQFYRSTDFVHWSRDEVLSGKISLGSDYAIAAHGDSLWITGSDAEDGGAILAGRYDAKQGKWDVSKHHGEAPDSNAKRERMWLMTNPVSGRLEVLQAADEGEIRRVEL